MSDFDSACELMEKQLGYDVSIALATCFENESYSKQRILTYPSAKT